MSSQHRFTTKDRPTILSSTDKPLHKDGGISARRRKPVVAPFTVKWPDSCQLHQVISNHERNQSQQQLVAKTVTPVVAANNTRVLAFSITAFNIAAVTILGWCLFEKIFGGRLFIGLESILVLSAGVTLWWSATITAGTSKQVEVEVEDLYDEDDFIIH